MMFTVSHQHSNNRLLTQFPVGQDNNEFADDDSTLMNDDGSWPDMPDIDAVSPFGKVSVIRMLP
jgi:hypothetical protein